VIHKVAGDQEEVGLEAGGEVEGTFDEAEAGPAMVEVGEVDEAAVVPARGEVGDTDGDVCDLKGSGAVDVAIGEGGGGAGEHRAGADLEETAAGEFPGGERARG
jgi:hypothetical protein